MGFERVALYPLHVAVLATLHVVFASIRLARVVVRLQPSRHRDQSILACPSPSADLASERWNKVPRHLAVILAPTKWRPGSEQDLSNKRQQLNELIRACKHLGIAELSVYDRDGLLVSNAHSLANLDPLHPFILKPTSDESPIVTLVPAASPTPNRDQGLSTLDDESLENASSDENGSATLVSDGTSTPKSSSSFTLRLLSREAGRPQLAHVARKLALNRATELDRDLVPLTSEKVAQVIDAFPLPEPDLLFVFGGSYLRLSGFPPWQIRLSEMYHYAFPAWLPSPPLDYSILRKALDVYGKAEMRLGR
ncbi:ditrans,polycis-polyprenyl diphosphate synthase [Sporobolomyces koalae]|uniref:ditrans,polycis-polyprenyl diphosphate synthase n=1 Tax=Sporobolomyces koalae TaxID=500713 RepID=UPI0031716404